jgi:hypothetical protein
MTTEQLAALKEVAEQVKGPFQSALHEVMWREEFHQRFTPTTCLELLEEVERLTAQIDRLYTCVVCEATLCEPETPPHCEDCILREEHYGYAD